MVHQVAVRRAAVAARQVVPAVHRAAQAVRRAVVTVPPLRVRPARLRVRHLARRPQARAVVHRRVCRLHRALAVALQVPRRPAILRLAVHRVRP